MLNAELRFTMSPELVVPCFDLLAFGRWLLVQKVQTHLKHDNNNIAFDSVSYCFHFLPHTP